MAGILDLRYTHCVTPNSKVLFVAGILVRALYLTSLRSFSLLSALP